MGAEKDLNDKIELLASLIKTKHIRFKDDDITRQLVDFIRALRTIRKLSKIIKTDLGINPTPHAISYLSNPND